MHSMTFTCCAMGPLLDRKKGRSFFFRWAELSTALLFAALLFCPSVEAGAPILLGLHNKTKIAVSSGAANQRVGKSALVRVHMQMEGLAWSETVLIGCDGTWISGTIHIWVNTEKKHLTFSEIERLARASEEHLPLESVELHDALSADQIYSGLLLRRAGSICKTAGREPRNVLIPLAGANEDDETASSSAVVLGTATVNAGVVDVWTRNTVFKRVPIIGEDGNPIYFDGRAATRPEPTGKHGLVRRVFDCRSRELAAYESSEYEPGKSVPKTWSWPRDKVRLQSAIPGSVGEALLDGICRLYVGSV